MNITKFLQIIFCGFVFFAFGISVSRAQSPQIDWKRQFGTGSRDVGLTVSADQIGNVFLGGYSWLSQNFVAKYNSVGDFQWYQGTSFPSGVQGSAVAVAADGVGNAYSTGWRVGGGTDTFT